MLASQNAILLLVVGPLVGLVGMCLQSTSIQQWIAEFMVSAVGRLVGLVGLCLQRCGMIYGETVREVRCLRGRVLVTRLLGFNPSNIVGSKQHPREIMFQNESTVPAPCHLQLVAMEGWLLEREGRRAYRLSGRARHLILLRCRPCSYDTWSGGWWHKRLGKSRFGKIRDSSGPS
jgi:hypothetical protein